MSNKCNAVVFSNKAYNAIIRETFEKEPIETGGILLGYIVDDTWVVMEVLPPGKHSVFQMAYFEYDDDFVNYLAHSVANQYERPLSLLGLWHRHPGSMDSFSNTDDGTNRTFAAQSPNGVISGLVNVDPRLRITMYYLDKESDNGFGRPPYERVDVEVGDDIIPKDFFRLRYYNGDTSELNPTISVNRETRNPSETHRRNYSHGNSSEQPSTPIIQPQIIEELDEASNFELFKECCKRFLVLIKRFWKEVAIIILLLCLILMAKDVIPSFKSHNEKCKPKVESPTKKSSTQSETSDAQEQQQEQQQNI